MLAALARNTAFSAVAFGVNGLVGLAILPVIVGAYGVALLGLIVIARIFLPSGALAIFDFGMSETATYSVGRARGSGDWTQAAQRIGLLLVLSIGLGVATALLLALAAPWLAVLFGVPADAHESFVAILTVTAFCLLVLFPGLVLEGVLKGFEHFLVLRGLEVIATLAYAGATVACVASGLSYAAVAYVYLAAMAGRYVVLGVVAAAEMRRAGLRPARWDAGARNEVLRRSVLMFQNKMLGALQMPVPPLLIGIFVGPGGVGVYEIVSRLPRVLKSAFSILASAVLPVAARLEGKGEGDRLAGLGLKSFWLVPYVTFPSLFAIAGLAQPILEVWVGRDFAAYWPWMAAMLIFPVSTVSLSVGQSMSLTKQQYIAGANRVSFWGLVAQYAVSLLFVQMLGAMAFVLGIVVAALATFPFHLRLVSRALSFSALSAWRLLAGHVVLAGLMALALAIASPPGSGASIGLVALAFGIAVLACWLAAYAILLEDAGRMLVRRLVLTVLHPARA